MTTGRWITALMAGGALWLGLPLPRRAQADPLPDRRLARELTRAESFLRSFKNDSAIALTSRLLTVLRARKQYDSPFGIRVQLAEAGAYEQDQQGVLALQKTLRVQQKSQDKGMWDVHARSCLVLALLYEKTELGERSREQLNLAETDIDQHRLGTLYPYFAIRRSSWERFYGSQQRALFFAREALRTAPLHRLVLEEAIGHMLMDILLPDDADDERLYHCLTAVRLYRKLSDYTGTSSMYYSASRIYRQRKEFRRALAYNDSAIAQANRATAEGHERSQRPAANYRQRGEIYEQLGRLDSALINLQKGYQLERVFNEADLRNKIVEAESRYQTRLSQQQIEEQQLAIHYKDNQLRFSVVIVLLVLVLAVGLFLAYRRQKQAKRILSGQNMLIQQQTEQLRSLDAVKSRFFANVSHELRTPLTLLLGPIGTLLTENHLTDKQAKLLQLARRSGQQLEQLVADLLDLGKLELSKLDLEVKPTPLAAFFRSHFAQFASLAENRGLTYTIIITVADDVLVALDQPKCRQILNNLLANAFKFTPSGGSVTASLQLADRCLSLSVADTGPGIHPDDLPHLFDRYFQTSRPGKPAEGGTGIGLALCQEYVQLMGGTIDVKSTLGTGTVFSVSLPVALLPADVAPAEAVFTSTAYLSPVSVSEGIVAANSHLDRLTLLVVEDNPDLQVYIRLILSVTYNVVIAENGQVALDWLRQPDPVRPSLILSDIMMPVMDGHQLLEQLKANDATRHIPVIMLTARADGQDKLRALRIGVDDYLLKPFDEEELLTRISNLLTNQTNRQQAVADEESIPDPVAPIMSQADREWLEDFEQYIRQHLADPTLTIPDLAHHFAVSESTLLRQLKRLTGLSTLQYVQVVRLEEGRRLLESSTNYSIIQVAARVGYDNARSFSQSFRSRFGKLPSELLET